MDTVYAYDRRVGFGIPILRNIFPTLFSPIYQENKAVTMTSLRILICLVEQVPLPDNKHFIVKMKEMTDARP